MFTYFYYQKDELFNICSANNLDTVNAYQSLALEFRTLPAIVIRDVDETFSVCGFDNCKQVVSYISSQLHKSRNLDEICDDVVMSMYNNHSKNSTQDSSAISEINNSLELNLNLPKFETPDIEELTVDIFDFHVLPKLDNLRKLTCKRATQVITCAFPKLIELTIELFSGRNDFSGFSGLESLIITGHFQIIDELDLRALDKLKIFKIDPNYRVRLIQFSDNTILNLMQINAMTQTNATVMNLDIIDNNEKDIICDYSFYQICDNLTFHVGDIEFVQKKTLTKATMKNTSLILPINILSCVIDCLILGTIAPSLSLTNLTINADHLLFSEFDSSFPQLKILTLNVKHTKKMTIYLPKLLTEFNIETQSDELTVVLNRRIEKITGKIPVNIFLKTGDIDELYSIELVCQDPSLRVMFSDIPHLVLS